MNQREQITDELLVLRSQEGDTMAFAELFDRWQERLWRHAWRLTGDEQAAYDALQESWIGIARSIRRLSDASAFSGWAYRIVSNKCRDWVRREMRRRKATEAYAERGRIDPRPASLPGGRVDRLREAMALLSGADRAMLSLRYEEGFNTAEIGEILCIPAGTVKSRLYSARKRLRGHMEEMDDERQ